MPRAFERVALNEEVINDQLPAHADVDGIRAAWQRGKPFPEFLDYVVIGNVARPGILE